MEEQTTNTKKYVIWLIISSLICIILVIFVIATNDKSENDLLYAINTIGINIAVNTIAALLLMIFFTNREKRFLSSRAELAAQKFATYLKKAIHVSETADKPELLRIFQRVEYYRDTFHNELDKKAISKIDDIILEKTPSTKSLRDILAVIEQKYGTSLLDQKKISTPKA